MTLTRERDGACGRCRGAEALLAMEKTFAPSMEGHLTKHWDGDDKVGGAHQAVTDADKKSEMIQVSLQRQQQQQQHQQALLGPGLDA